MLFDHTHEVMMRLLVNETRQAKITGSTLAESHRVVGRALAASVARCLTLDEVTIDHVAGASTGVQIKCGGEPIVVAMLRAGLFVAEGIWSSLPGSSLVLHAQGIPLETLPASGRPIVIVDSVINTGKSIRETIETALAFTPSSIEVAAIVAFKGNMESLVEEYPEINFHIARISERSYVGKGATDTGARLYGTINWSKER